MCVTKALKLNCKRIEKIGLLKYLGYLVKLNEEKKKTTAVSSCLLPSPTFLSPSLPLCLCLSVLLCLSLTLTGEIALENDTGVPWEQCPATALTDHHTDPQMECRVCPLSCSTPPFQIIPIGIIQSICIELLLCSKHYDL